MRIPEFSTQDIEKLILEKEIIVSDYHKINIIYHNENNGRLQLKIGYNDENPVCEIRAKLGNTNKSFSIMMFVPMQKIFRNKTFFECISTCDPFGKIFSGYCEVNIEAFKIKLNNELKSFIKRIE